LRNLGNLLVHLFGRNGDLDRIYLASVHDRCLFCEEEISETAAYQTYRVCPYCRFHYTLSARQRIELLADKRSFKESHKYLNSVAPISFSQRGSYRNLLSQDQNRTGLTEATVTGSCRIGGIRAMMVVLDFGFMGGSMGSVVGEKIALGLETAAQRDLPLVALVTGGGARIQEGVLSLMQMAKTVTAANRFKQKGQPFIVLLANPCTGQAYASFANLADVILAEPGSLIGLSPLRTLREVSGTPLPQDAHTAEAHLQHGLLDNVVDRESMKPRLITLLRVLTGQKLGKGEFKPATRSRLKIGPNPEAWEAVTASRNGERPSATFYIRTILDPFVELHGDRLSGDDRSIIAGLGYLNGEPVAIIGQQRPYSLNGESYHVYPDGLRKAQRLIKLATRFELPLVTLLDTQGADPGLEAEEQGIGNAIATTLSLMAEAPVPIVSAIIGEGGNEGALALGISDRIVMQQYAIYSPISLNRTLGGSNGDPELDREAAEALMLTAQDCLELGIIDSIVPEPVGGAHTNSREAATALQNALVRQLKAVSKLSPSKLLGARYKKFRQMGEKSAYSQEAMDREVELLVKISNAPLRPSGRGRAQRKRAPETVEAVETIPEAQPLPLEVD
jgi:acetyl-CoA carboxylase carboxyl transferase subunit beta